jgi:secreted PhoX family phosphatase
MTRSRTRTRRFTMTTVIAIAAVAAVGTAAAVAKFDSGFGVERDQELAKNSEKLFGVGRPLAESSAAQITPAQAQADPTKMVTLAKKLKAHVVTTQGPAVDDQISLWPDSMHPTHLIVCNEQGTTAPGLVRIDLATGDVSSIVTGTTSCDPTRRTPWGTILFGEEAGQGGQLYELIDPLHTTGVTLDRTTGTFSGGVGSQNIVRRDALGRAAFEGIGILDDGTTYLAEDDSGLGPKNGGPGNFFFKFVPQTPFHGMVPITDLAQSPFAAGDVFGLRVGLSTNYGQGREFGFAQWIAFPHADNPNLEADGIAAGLTGYYRLEDSDIDPIAMANGNVRVCTPATGDETNHLYGEVVCFTDGTVAEAQANMAQPEVQPFVFGGTSQGINMPDNVAFQPATGNVIVHEDAETTFETPHNNDLWDCLPDGADQDLLSDGCIRIATLNDLTAEWTGGIFDASGTHFYVSIQHNISGQATILDITGWR